jgi:hypothetical protein
MQDHSVCVCPWNEGREGEREVGGGLQSRLLDRPRTTNYDDEKQAEDGRRDGIEKPSEY